VRLPAAAHAMLCDALGVAVAWRRRAPARPATVHLLLVVQAATDVGDMAALCPFLLVLACAPSLAAPIAAGGDDAQRYERQLVAQLETVRAPSAATSGDILTVGGASHLKVMTFYGGTADQLHGWTNVHRGSLADCDNKTITGLWKMKVLIQLPPTIFDRAHKSLHSGWSQATAAFIASAKPHITGGRAMGVFMGDEICCGGTPYSNMSAVAAQLKAGLPDAWIYTNECSEMEHFPPIAADGSGGVPAGLDAISVDFCVALPRMRLCSLLCMRCRLLCSQACRQHMI
jgi:hypothetical protein